MPRTNASRAGRARRVALALDERNTQRYTWGRMPSKRMLVTPIRFPEALLRRLDRHAEQLRREQPGVEITRSDVIRLLLGRALDAVEGKGVRHGKAQP